MHFNDINLPERTSRVATTKTIKTAPSSSLVDNEPFAYEPDTPSNYTIGSMRTNQRVHRRGTKQYFKEIFNRHMNVTHKELLAASDVNIVQRKQMRIYGIANLIFFAL